MARWPRGAQAWVGVIAVLMPVSSTNTRRFASICSTSLRYRRRLACTLGSSRSRACRVFFLLVWRKRRRVRQRVVRVQAKPPHSFNWFKVASACSAISIASRTCSGKPRTGRGPPPWGLGAQGAGVPTPLEQSGDERDTDAESLGDLTLGAFALIDRRRNTLPEIHRIGSHGQPPSAPRPCQEDSCVPYYRIMRASNP